MKFLYQIFFFFIIQSSIAQINNNEQYALYSIIRDIEIPLQKKVVLAVEPLPFFFQNSTQINDEIKALIGDSIKYLVKQDSINVKSKIWSYFPIPIYDIVDEKDASKYQKITIINKIRRKGKIVCDTIEKNSDVVFISMSYPIIIMQKLFISISCSFTKGNGYLCMYIYEKNIDYWHLFKSLSCLYF